MVSVCYVGWAWHSKAAYLVEGRKEEMKEEERKRVKKEERKGGREGGMSQETENRESPY